MTRQRMRCQALLGLLLGLGLWLGGSGASGALDLRQIGGVGYFPLGVVLGGNETLTSYDEGTFTVTGTGFTVAPTGTARYVRLGKLVLLEIPDLTGTSNTTAFTLTGLPAGLVAAQATYRPLLVADNGVQQVGFVVVDGSTTLTLYPGAATFVWTASGTKTILAVALSYRLP